ncbi:MAG: hypothetical protein FJ146_18075 [Deltaproteobacteria bacterium]|nr:hypothetical protein [Deltaproteobacteria bacterium]
MASLCRSLPSLVTYWSIAAGGTAASSPRPGGGGGGGGTNWASGGGGGSSFTTGGSTLLGSGSHAANTGDAWIREAKKYHRLSLPT